MWNSHHKADYRVLPRRPNLVVLDFRQIHSTHIGVSSLPFPSFQVQCHVILDSSYPHGMVHDQANEASSDRRQMVEQQSAFKWLFH